jgi:hypothetical protein
VFQDLRDDPRGSRRCRVTSVGCVKTEDFVSSICDKPCGGAPSRHSPTYPALSSLAAGMAPCRIFMREMRTIGLIRDLWRRHQVRVRDRREFGDQERRSPHGLGLLSGNPGREELERAALDDDDRWSARGDPARPDDQR